jgi:hypothetical protein
MNTRPLAEQRALYRAAGWISSQVEFTEAVAAPARMLARQLVQRRPRQDLLSGVHNPFGHHACPGEAWRFLDLAESAELLDQVVRVLGPDIVLWDSELYPDPAAWPRDEAQYWPVDPLAGTVVALDLERRRTALIDITRLASVFDDIAPRAGPCYTLRYMPASSLYNRDPRFAPNRRATQVRPLVNHCNRPIWLVRGKDRAGSDFVTGFAPPAARWAEAVRLRPEP